MDKEHDFIGEVLAEDKEARRPRTLSEMNPVERLAHARGETLPPVTVINGLAAEIARLTGELAALKQLCVELTTSPDAVMVPLPLWKRLLEGAQ